MRILPSKKGQVTLDSVIGLTVTLLVIGFLIGIALIMNQGFQEAADEGYCASGYQYNTTNSACCLGGDCTTNATRLSAVNDTLGTIDTAFTDIAGWMPLVALALIAVIIIGLMMIFRGAGRRGI